MGALRRLAKRQEERLRSGLPPGEPSAEAYEREYHRAVSGEGMALPMAEILDAVAATDVVFIGTFHGLAESHIAAARVLEGMAEGRGDGGVDLAVVVARDGSSPILGEYAEGRMSEKALLGALRSDWPFPLHGYARLLRVARHLSCRIIGLRPPVGWQGPPDERSRYSARILARHWRASGRPLLVVDGDFHCVPGHLPAHFRQAAGSAFSGRRILCLCQNVSRIAWAAFEAGLDAVPPAARLGPDLFHLHTAHPLRKLNAYFNWLEEEPEIQGKMVRSWVPRRLRLPRASTVLRRLCRKVADACGLEDLLAASDLRSLSVFGPDDPAFLDRLASQGLVDEAEAEDFLSQAEGNRSYFLPGRQVVYLADLRAGVVAEEIAHWLHGLADPSMASGFVLDLEDEFYEHVVRECLAFLGSRAVQPDREAPALDLLEGTLARSFPADGADLGTSPWWERFLEAPPSERGAVIHYLGYGLGDALDRVVRGGSLGGEGVSALFREPLRLPGAARQVYLTIRSLTDSQRT